MPEVENKNTKAYPVDVKGVCDNDAEPHARFATCENWRTLEEEEKRKANTSKLSFHTALAKMRLSTKEQGAALIVAGLDKLKKQFNEKLVYFVTTTMDQLRNLEDQRDDLEGCIAFQKDRLQAIHDGKFRIDNRGNLWFDEQRLNAGMEGNSKTSITSKFIEW